MKIPDVVAVLLGPDDATDATPKEAIRFLESHATADAFMRNCTLRSESDRRSANRVWQNALGAAAIRLAERLQEHGSLLIYFQDDPKAEESYREYLAIRDLPKKEKP